MTDRTEAKTLERVLIEFAISCPRPTIEDVERLIASHPEHESEIIRSATLRVMEMLTGRDRVELRHDPRDEPFIEAMVEKFMGSTRPAA